MSSTERLTKDKQLGFTSVVTGQNRVREFDGMLDTIPDYHQIKTLEAILCTQRGTFSAIKQVIYDQDGTLGGAYEGVHPLNALKLGELKAKGIEAAIITNDPSAEKQAEAASMGIPLFGNPDFPKPNRKAFEAPLKELGWDPRHTIFIGDTPATDKPFISQAGLQPLSKLQSAWALRNGFSAPELESTNTEAPTADYHPNRESELLLANFLVLPQPFTKRLALGKEIRRRAFKVMINAGAKAVIQHHPHLITTAHIQAELKSWHH